MKKITLVLLSAVLIVCCKNQTTSNMSNVNGDFDKFKSSFIEDLWTVYPGWAASVGYHKYDSALVIPNEASRKEQLVSS